MNYYAIQYTDSTGTHILENNYRSRLLFIHKTNAEQKACKIANNYNLVQVINYDLYALSKYYIVADND